MQQLYSGLKAARGRVKLLAEVMRWVWVTNSVVMVVAIMEKRWELAAVAGVTWVMTIVAAAVAKRVDIYLNQVERLARENCVEQGEAVPALETLVGLENQ